MRAEDHYIYELITTDPCTVEVPMGVLKELLYHFEMLSFGNANHQYDALVAYFLQEIQGASLFSDCAPLTWNDLTLDCDASQSELV